jgi:hypothetical protein
MMHFVSQKVAPMLDMELRSLAHGFRARAEEILLRAETMHDISACLKLREIAASYERLARRVEQREPRKLETVSGSIAVRRRNKRPPHERNSNR